MNNNPTECVPVYSLTTPVLFLVFNRLDTTKQVFETIRTARPRKLYIAADGPRELREGEAQKIKEVRDYVVNNVDWDCEVKTLFREKNLGCKNAVSGGVNWFFEHEEQGIILEDDCLPSQSFFRFCQELLCAYRHDKDIGMISGNMLYDQIKVNESYLYTYGNIWGWATWRDRWSLYDVDIKSWSDEEVRSSIEAFLANRKVYRFVSALFDTAYNGKIDTWDYQWLFARLKNRLLTINPSRNLVANIGFGENATHTKVGGRSSALKRNEISFPLKHPKEKKLNHDYVKLQYRSEPLMNRIMRRCGVLFEKHFQ
jgi:hypothetical protein